jgi:hypothetical protein
MIGSPLSRLCPAGVEARPRSSHQRRGVELLIATASIASRFALVLRSRASCLVCARLRRLVPRPRRTHAITRARRGGLVADVRLRLRRR